MNTTPSVSEEMIEAGLRAMHPDHGFPTPAEQVAAIYLAMKASEPYAGQTDVERVALAERLKKRAEEEREWAANSQLVADLLQPQMDAFEARTGHNIYAVRMAVDHKNDAKKYIAEAEDHEAAAALLVSNRSGVE